MKNPFKKHLAASVTMAHINAEQEERNISATRAELDEARKVGARELCHNIAPNRKERRGELKTARYEKANGREDGRVVVNNRRTAGPVVFDKMAYFHMSIDLQRKQALKVKAAKG